MCSRPNRSIASFRSSRRSAKKRTFRRWWITPTLAANDYNLSVSSYVEARDTREAVDIALLNAEVAETVVRIDALRRDIDTIIAELSA